MHIYIFLINVIGVFVNFEFLELQVTVVFVKKL